MQKNTSANSTVTVGSSNGIVWILVKKQAHCAKRVICELLCDDGTIISRISRLAYVREMVRVKFRVNFA